MRAKVPLLGYAAIYAKRMLALLLILLAVTTTTILTLRRIWRQPISPHPRSCDSHTSLSG